MDFLLSSDRMSRLELLSKSCPSTLQLADITVPVVDKIWQRRRDKVLVLAMIIYHPYYLVLLTCTLVFDKIALRKSKSLVVVVVVVKYMSE